MGSCHLGFLDLMNITNEFLSDKFCLPEELKFEFKVFLISIYCILIPFSLVGNILVCLVILSNKSMRTVTNVFLASLAISDMLIVSWNMPMSLLYNLQNEWTFGEPLCKFTNYLQAVNILTSIITLTVVALERYFAICHPLRARNVRTPKRAVVCLVVVWMAALSISLPMLWIQRQGRRLVGKGHSLRQAYVCEEYFQEKRYDVIYTYILFMLCYMVPMVIMLSAYGMIAYKLWIRKPIGEAKSSQLKISTLQKKKIIRMLITLVLIFGICWLPFFSIMLYHLYHNIDSDSRVMMIIVHLIGYSNSLCNPIVYGFLNEKFQINLKYMCVKCRERIESGGQRSPRVMSLTAESIV